METLKKLVSLEEKRVSTLMTGMIVTLVFALLMYWRRGDVTSNLVDILKALIAGVVGVSIASMINSYLGKGGGENGGIQTESDKTDKTEPV